MESKDGEAHILASMLPDTCVFTLKEVSERRQLPRAAVMDMI